MRRSQVSDRKMAPLRLDGAGLGFRRELLPALQKPTVAALSDPDWVDVNTILEETLVRSLIPKLKAVGGKGIVEYPISKIID